ncbi:MAG: hemolysin family protein [Micromonosporaceae bacterium]
MIEILVALGLLLGNAFFVGAEFALIASRRTIIEPMAATLRRAAWALSAMNQIPLMIAGAQLGITICSLGLGAIAEPALARQLAGPFVALGLPASAAHPVAFLIALAIIVVLHTVIGEMVPKNIAIAGPEASVVWLGPLMLGFCNATKPLLLAMKWLARQVLRIWRIEATEAVKTVFTAEELSSLVLQARTEGLLDPVEHERITAALALHRHTAEDALRAWADVTTVSEDVSPASLEVLATRTGRSRFPVVARQTRRVLGFVHVKDVLGYTGARRREPIPPELIRPLLAVAPERTLAELLLAMRRGARHIALVTDGRTPLGIVTLEDVLNAVVGNGEAPSLRA